MFVSFSHEAEKKEGQTGRAIATREISPSLLRPRSTSGSRINPVDSLYRSRSARRYTPECPSNAPESPYYGNRLPIRFRDTRLYVLSGPYKRVMIERRRNVRKNLCRSWRSEHAFGRGSPIAPRIYSHFSRDDVN